MYLIIQLQTIRKGLSLYIIVLIDLHIKVESLESGRKLMAWKYIKIFIVVMMELFILTLKLQANDLAPTTFSRSTLPIRYLHSSKPAEVQGDQDPLTKCLENGIKDCENCIFKIFTDCLKRVKIGQKWPRRISRCLTKCQQHKHRTEVVTCYIRCYEKHVKKKGVQMDG